jgi:hypothetical protein
MALLAASIGVVAQLTQFGGSDERHATLQVFAPNLPGLTTN